MRRSASNDNGRGPVIRLHPVRSRGVRALGYDSTHRLLDIMYPDGDLYRYSGVSPQRHRALVTAESIGGYVNRHIKPHYKFTRLN
jgi:hypothetical protein